MGTIVKSVGAGKDYATWQAAIDSLPKNLVADNNSYIIEGYSGTEFTSNARVMNITGFTCDATRNITIRAAAGNSWRDSSTVLSSALTYDATKGVAINSSLGFSSVILSDAAYLTITGLQVKNTQNCKAMELGGANNVVSNCIIDTIPDTYTVYFTGSNCVLSNTVVLNRNPGSRCVVLGSNNLATNCTLVTPSDRVSGNGFGIVNFGSNAATVENTAIFGFTNPAGGNTINGTNNATDMTLPAGMTGLTGVDFASQFVVSVNTGNDLRLKAGSVLIDAGKTTSYPIAGNKLLRPSGTAYDIGAWETPQTATALQIIGDTSGVAGYNIRLEVIKNGTLSSTVVVTPSDNSGGGTFTPTSYSWTPTGPSPVFNYVGTAGTKSITITNNGGLTNGTAQPVTVISVPTPPTGTVTNQPAPDGSNLVVTFSTTNTPTSGVATLNPAASNPNGAVQTTGTVSLGTNTGTASFTNIPPGNYSLVITLSNADGMNAVTGTQPVSIVGVSGNPQAPDPVTDNTAPVMQGSLSSSNVTQTSYTLAWQAATDDTGVTGYEFSSNGTTYTDLGNTLSYIRTGLTQNTTYTNYVRAYDAAGNKSTPLTLSVTTMATYVASVVFKLRTGDNPAINLSNLKWAWFDQSSPALFTAPTDKGSVETTDENGNIFIALPNSAKTSGQIGWLIVTDSDGNPNNPHKAFSGPRAVV